MQTETPVDSLIMQGVHQQQYQDGQMVEESKSDMGGLSDDAGQHYPEVRTVTIVDQNEVDILDQDKATADNTLESSTNITPNLKISPGYNQGHHMRNRTQDESELLLRTSSPLLQGPSGFTTDQLRNTQAGNETQITASQLTTQSSDELRAASAFSMTKMAPTTQRPASANFATQQQRVRRIGSFVSSNHSIDKARYSDRVPVRLVFKHEKLEALANANLKSRTVMALQSLTVKEFMAEVVIAMKASQSRIHKSQIEIAFCSKTVKFPIHFQGNEYLEKVFKKICAIEESRELSINSSSEDLHLRQQQNSPQLKSNEQQQAAKQQQQATTQQYQSKIAVDSAVVAEFNLRVLKKELSDGGGHRRHPKKRSRHESTSENYRQKRHHDSGRIKKPRSQSSEINSEREDSSCTIF